MDKSLIPVVAVLLIVWLGFFAYLLHVDRALKRVEREEKGQDEL